MEKRNGAIISTREKGGTRETLAVPLFCSGSASVLSDFPAPALLPITPREQHGGQPRDGARQTESLRLNSN
jgi:hypothetical protein